MKPIGWWFVAAVALAVPWTGCGPKGSQQDSRVNQVADRGDLFAWIAENVQRLDEAQGDQLLPQLLDRLNQWIHREPPAGPFVPDPLIGTMADRFQKLATIKSLPSLEFRPEDAEFLQEAVWLRDIARNVCGSRADDIEAAGRLFDWTVRHLQLEADDSADWPGGVLIPREVLLFGRATTVERAWLFILLCRQQGLDAVWLELPGKGDARPRPWAVGVLIHEQLYLFDPRLGLPIAGPEGRLVATLAEVVADESLLVACNLDDDHPYGVTAADAAAAVVRVEGGRGYLAHRMKAVERRLSGQGRLVLSVDASRLAERVKAAGPSDVRLWEMPYEVRIRRVQVQDGKDESAAKKVAALAFVLSTDPRRDPRESPEQTAAGAEASSAVGDDDSQDFGKVFQGLAKTPLRAKPGSARQATGGSRQPLAAARMLQFRGEWSGERGARAHYERLWLSPKQIAAIGARGYPAEALAVLQRASQSAVYWLGLLALDEGQFDAAVTYLGRLTLEAESAGPWRNGARFNLALAYRAAGRSADAARLLAADKSPQQHGNRLRAKRLQEKATGE